MSALAIIQALLSFATQAPAYITEIVALINAIKADLAQQDLAVLEAELTTLRASMPAEMAAVDAALDAAAQR
jgi:hypothetical protein